MVVHHKAEGLTSEILEMDNMGLEMIDMILEEAGLVVKAILEGEAIKFFPLQYQYDQMLRCQMMLF